MVMKYSDKPFWPAVRWLADIYGIVFCIMAYAAPNFFFGVNGVFPNYYKQTCLESNDLDPITIHYFRCAASQTLTLCLAHIFFFDNEHFAAYSRAFSRMALCCTIGIFLDFSSDLLLRNTKDTFYQESFVIMAVIHFLLALYYVRVLQDIPTSTRVSTPTRIQRITNLASAAFALTFCVGRIFFGASSLFFPNTPLENNEFDTSMMGAAHSLGYSLVPAVYGTLVEGNTIPQLIIKMECLSGVLLFPIFFKAAHDTSGYFNQEAFTYLTVVHVLMLMLQFYAAGAFGSSTTETTTTKKKAE